MPSAEMTLPALGADTDAATLKHRSVHGAVLTFGAQGFRIVLQLGSQIVMMHLLDPAAFGLIAMIMPVLSLVQIFNELGLTQATIQRSEITHDDLSALFWISLGISGGLAVILALAAPLVAIFYHEPRLVPVVICSASLLLLSGASAQQIALMNRRMRYAALATIDVACAAMAVCVGIATALAGFGYWSLVLMQAANSLTIAMLAWALSDWRPSWRPRATGALELVRFGGHLTAFNVLGYAENNLGNILLGRLCGSVALGIYDRAFKLVIVPWWQISLPVARVAIALLSRLRGCDELYIRAHHRMLQGLLLAALPGLIWASMSADRLVPMVLGPDWSAAVPVVSWLSLATTLVPFGSGAYWLYVSQGRVADQLRWGCVSATAVIVSMVIGVYWGPVGVARSYAAFAIIIQGSQLWGATRQGPVTLAGVLRAAYPIFVGAAFSAVAIHAAQVALGRAGTGNILNVLVGLLVSYCTCGACLLCFPDGIRILHDVWALRSTLQRAPALT
jgi:polysaccharide transporter, PST family